MGWEKKIQKSELPIFNKLAKSIVSALPISKGSIIKHNMLTTKGPGTGISPMKMGMLIGKTTKEEIPEDTIILESQINW